MSMNYRNALAQVRDLKVKQDILQLNYDEEHELLLDPIIIKRQHVIAVLKRFKQERLSQEDLFDWIHFVWFSDFFTSIDEDAECISSVIQVLEELEEEGNIMIEDIEPCLYALENNIEAKRLLYHDL